MLRKAVDIANLVVALIAGAYLVVLTLADLVGSDWPKMLPHTLVGSAFFWMIPCFVVGVFVVVANVYVLMDEWKTVGIRSNLRIPTDQGMTEFSVPSIEMLILRDLKAEPDIVDPVVFLQPKGEGKPMLCKVELKLRRQKDVIKRIDAIKKKVRDTIDGLIPGGLTVEVPVEVRDFVSETIRNNRSSREILPDPNEFNGPVYTDGGGSEGV